MEELQEMLHGLNPYVKLYKAMAELEEEYDAEELTFFLTRNKKPGNEHIGRYNLPTCDEVALMHIGEKTESADFQVHFRSGQVKYISSENQACDPLLYILLFPEGSPGWTFGNKTSKDKNISATMWYKYLFQVREEHESGQMNVILRSRRLMQEFACASDWKIECQNLKFIQLKQKELRADKYFKVQDAIHIGEDLNAIKKNMNKIVLPSTYKCSPRWFHMKYHDAMAICRAYGKPTLFVTFTANANWPEIKGSLHHGESSQDRPDIVARVFMMRLKECLDVLKKKSLLGRVKALVAVIEHQKRGLPHCHILVWLIGEDCPKTPEDWDNFVSCEIPDKKKNPRLFETVQKFMKYKM